MEKELDTLIYVTSMPKDDDEMWIRNLTLWLWNALSIIANHIEKDDVPEVYRNGIVHTLCLGLARFGHIKYEDGAKTKITFEELCEAAMSFQKETVKIIEEKTKLTGASSSDTLH